MPRRDVPVHRLAENARNWTPGHVAFFDTETQITVDPQGETHRLRLWAMRAVDRRPVKGKEPRNATYHGDTGAQLAAQIGECAKGRSALWLFAHNLAFDLATSALPRHLVADGWDVGHVTMGGKSCWLRFSRKSTVLTFADSWTWLPVALQDIGEATGIPKPRLPLQEADADEWLTRCETDVDILAQAMLDLMSWFDTHKLGNWSTTGAATGWNTYRHHDGTTDVVIHPEPAIIKEDRTYVNGGRRATWQLGRHVDGPYLELDITAAYPTIAANYPLPRQHRAAFDMLPLDAWQIDSNRWGPVARCLIRTAQPCVPVKWSGATFYPVGEFWANLTGPDIREARNNGRLAFIGPGRVHQLSCSMRPWSRWVLATMAGQVPRTPEVARIATKHWSRSTIGKWAAHAFTTTELGRSPNDGWGFEDAWDHNGQCRAQIQDIAGTRFIVSGAGDPENAYPAIFAWVESYVRVALHRVIDVIGEGALLTANTDGMIVSRRVLGTDAAGGSALAPQGLIGQAKVDWVLARCNESIAPLTIRVKASHGAITVLGPQHIDTGDRRAFSGVPAGAKVVATDTYEFNTWPGLARQVQAGLRGEYRRDKRTVKITGPFPSGWILTDNTVRPIEMTVTELGENRVLPWASTRWAAVGDQLSDTQRPELIPFMP